MLEFTVEDVIQLARQDGSFTPEIEAQLHREWLLSAKHFLKSVATDQPEKLPELLQTLDLEKRLAGLKAEERLAGLKAEERQELLKLLLNQQN